MSDTPNQIANKIKKHAFSGAFHFPFCVSGAVLDVVVGGQETMEEHRKLGGNPDVDVAYQYLGFFLEDDEEYETLAKVNI